MATLTAAVPPAPTFSRSIPHGQKIRQCGFSLTEVAVVMVIVALLIGGMILPMSAQQDMRANTETRKLLADVSEALLGFAASHAANDGKPYLPCPDTDNDGIENRTGSACTSQSGMLPWADLGLGRQDAWGNALHYAVTDVFSSSATGFVLLSAGSLRICEDSPCTTVLANAVPAVILSTGKNGQLTPADTSGDFIQRTPDAGHDDVTAWLPTTLLINRMISAGMLP
jgi:prepilin-type N-terminal cleavage/methylation domain-containing protein